MLNFIGLLSLPDQVSSNGGAKRQLGGGGEGCEEASFFAILQCALGLDEANTSQAQSFAVLSRNFLPVFSSHGVETDADGTESTEGTSEAPSPEALPEEGIAETDINPLLSFQVERGASFLALHPFADEGAVVSEKRCDGILVEKAQEPTPLLFEDAAVNSNDTKDILLVSELSKGLGKNGSVETDEVETDENSKGMFIPGGEGPKDKAGPLPNLRLPRNGLETLIEVENEEIAVSLRGQGGILVEKAQEPTPLLFEDAAVNSNDTKDILLVSELSKGLGKNGSVETDEVETDENSKGMFIPGGEGPKDKAGPYGSSTNGRVATGIEVGSATEAALKKGGLTQESPPQGSKNFVSDEESTELAPRREPFEKKLSEAKADLPLKAFQGTSKAHKNAPAEGSGAMTNDGRPDFANVNRSFTEALPHLANRSHSPIGETTDLGRNGAFLPLSVDLEGEGAEAAGDGLSHAIRFIHQGNIDRAYVVVEPPEWGRIQIDLGLSKDGIEAFIRVENEELAASLRGQMEGLKAALESSGINLAHVAVEAKGGDTSRGSGDQPEERRRKKASDPHIGEDGVEGAVFQLDLDRGLLCWIA